jgi:hypothetical protein
MNHNFWFVQKMMEERQETIRREAEIRRRIAEAMSRIQGSSLKAVLGGKLIAWGLLLRGEREHDCVEA